MKMQALLITSVLSVGIVQGAEIRKNLLDNGGFENINPQNGRIQHWSCSDWGNAKGVGKTSLSIQNDATEGKNAVKLTTTGKNRRNLLLFQKIAPKIESGKKYMLTFLFKAGGREAIGASVGASVFATKKGQKEALLYKHADKLKATEQWQKIDLTFTAPEQFTRAQIMLRANKKNVLFDNAILKEI